MVDEFQIPRRSDALMDLEINLQQYDFSVAHRSGNKQTNADALSCSVV